jgi:alcohol dehydrogenase
VHALAYPLGGEFHVAHGVSNAILLPHVLAFNLPAAEDRYADIAVAAGGSASGSTEAQARRGLELIEALTRDCGVPMRMSEHGVPADALDRMTDGAMTVTRLLERNVRDVAWDDARRIYEAALWTPSARCGGLAGAGAEGGRGDRFSQLGQPECARALLATLKSYISDS